MKMRKKILLLGGSHGQIPAIEEAKQRGLYTILCDYLPNNPGKNLADEFHLVSTTDRDKVLEVARNRNVDSILAYASDPAALTVAYVSEQMGFTGNSPESVELLSYKDLFRNFQASHYFNTPRFKVLSNRQDFSVDELNSLLPAVVKPVDGADTKGVSLVTESSGFHAAVSRAFNFARCGRIIIEEVVDDDIAQLHGDGFVLNGKLVFCELGDQSCTSKSAPLKPTSTSFPSEAGEDPVQRVIKTTEEQIKKSGFQQGPVNIEARIDSKNRVYIMEIGARSGGTLTPQCISAFCGFDMLKAQFDLAEGKHVVIERTKFKPSLLNVIYSDFAGVFQDFKLHEDLRPYLTESRIYKKQGEPVKSFEASGSTIGVLIFNFKTLREFREQKKDLYQKIAGGLVIEKTKSVGSSNAQ